MLVPAILYKQQIEEGFQKYFYTTDMMYEQGYLGSRVPAIHEEDDGSDYQYAIVNKDGCLVGYLAYYVDWHSSNAYNFVLFSFDRGNPLVGKDLLSELTKLIEEYKLHRIEWKVVGGNPVKRTYDKFCSKYNGRVLELKDVFKDRYGKYHNTYIYEIINEGVAR